MRRTELERIRRRLKTERAKEIRRESILYRRSVSVKGNQIGKSIKKERRIKIEERVPNLGAGILKGRDANLLLVSLTERARLTKWRERKVTTSLRGGALHHQVVGVGVGVKAAALPEVEAAALALHEVRARKEENNKEEGPARNQVIPHLH